ncbi:hypothetical protein [Chelatococcus sp.]|uniref:hypothetical protein n=1 Tax=Chelatococcus sp. TaxID=1953771 RepID=UPI0025C68974|nr:hypothetical protein [Chelatococcus sp.]MBX3559526.1 hypothetical protein [Chelatococcus sp.]
MQGSSVFEKENQYLCSMSHVSSAMTRRNASPEDRELSPLQKGIILDEGVFRTKLFALRHIDCVACEAFIALPRLP